MKEDKTKKAKKSGKKPDSKATDKKQREIFTKGLEDEEKDDIDMVIEHSISDKMQQNSSSVQEMEEEELDGDEGGSPANKSIDDIAEEIIE